MDLYPISLGEVILLYYCSCVLLQRRQKLQLCAGSCGPLLGLYGCYMRDRVESKAFPSRKNTGFSRLLKVKYADTSYIVALPHASIYKLDIKKAHL